MPLEIPTTPIDPVSFVLETGTKDIPDEVLRAAQLLLLDTLGVCAAAARMETSALATETAFQFYNTRTETCAARLMFDGRMASRPGAAFASATAIDNLDAHDGYNPTKGHIGVAVVPALVACAEQNPDLSGADALTALVVGYEIAGRAGIALHETVSDYHTSGAWNALGVASLAARLSGARPEVLRQALGIAEYHGPRSQMMREIANPTMLHDGSGQGALVGMSAFEMANMGFTGAPAITAEAPEVQNIWSDLGTSWQVPLQYIKPYPICRWAHAAIDAVKEISEKNDVDPQQIAQIEIRGFENAVQLFSQMPTTTSQAQYSLPFAVAVMILHGRIGVEHITGSALADPAVAALVARTTLSVEPRHEARYPEGRWSDVTLVLHDGTRLSSGDTHARGGPERPYVEADIVEKFMDYAAPVLGKARAERIRDATLSLTEPSTLFSDLSHHLFDPADGPPPHSTSPEKVSV